MYLRTIPKKTTNPKIRPPYKIERPVEMLSSPWNDRIFIPTSKRTVHDTHQKNPKKDTLCNLLQLFLYRKVDKVHTDTISYKGADSHLPTDSCKKKFYLFVEAEIHS